MSHPFAIMVAILAGCSVLCPQQSVRRPQRGWSGNESDRPRHHSRQRSFLDSGLWFLSEQLLPMTNREQDLRYHRIKNKQLRTDNHRLRAQMGLWPEPHLLQLPANRGR
jgi:hypothetical protein